jgi:hypothetical protein
VAVGDQREDFALARGDRGTQAQVCEALREFRREIISACGHTPQGGEQFIARRRFLHVTASASVCESILEGLTLADAAALAGVSRQTVNEWRRRGEEKPDSLYGEFSEAFELAKLQSKKGMIQKLLRHKDPRWTWKLMCNRWPEEFRDHVATEISGPNGVPLMPQNPFNVEIRLADSEEIQTDFEVKEPDGSISHVHYDPYGLERQREARKQQKDATS